MQANSETSSDLTQDMICDWHVLDRLSALAPPGAVPVVRGVLVPLGTAVSWGVSPQRRAAHGPLHSAVTYPLRLCWVCQVQCRVFSGINVGCYCGCCFVSEVGMVSVLSPF